MQRNNLLFLVYYHTNDNCQSLLSTGYCAMFYFQWISYSSFHSDVNPMKWYYSYAHSQVRNLRHKYMN